MGWLVGAALPIWKANQVPPLFSCCRGEANRRALPSLHQELVLYSVHSSAAARSNGAPNIERGGLPTIRLGCWLRGRRWW